MVTLSGAGQDKLILVARYDGIDLPGDSCRILVIDGLPRGEALLDRFIDESVRVGTVRVEHVATRLTQAIGRIFRSNTDQGVVVLAGQSLISWVRNPLSHRFLPPLLQRQLKFSLQIDSSIRRGEVTREEIIDSVIDSTDEWDTLYQGYIDQDKSEDNVSEDEWYQKVVHAEVDGYKDLWTGKYESAALGFKEAAELADAHDDRQSAWDHHWAGLSFLMAGDITSAAEQAHIASRTRRELGKIERALPEIDPSTLGGEQTDQTTWIADLLISRGSKALSQVDTVIANLSYAATTPAAESAACDLGSLLGFQASRPDREINTGPDVLWQGAGSIEALGLELKTDKEPTSEYTKHEVDQCLDHQQWLEQQFGDSVRLIVIGRHLPVDGRANPREDHEVVELDVLRDIAVRLRKMFEITIGTDKHALPSVIGQRLRYEGLTWNDTQRTLSGTLLIDLK